MGCLWDSGRALSFVTGRQRLQNLTHTKQSGLSWRNLKDSSHSTLDSRASSVPMILTYASNNDHILALSESPPLESWLPLSYCFIVRARSFSSCNDCLSLSVHPQDTRDHSFVDTHLSFSPQDITERDANILEQFSTPLSSTPLSRRRRLPDNACNFRSVVSISRTCSGMDGFYSCD